MAAISQARVRFTAGSRFARSVGAITPTRLPDNKNYNSLLGKVSSFYLDDSGTAEVELLHTDQEVLPDKTVFYTVTWLPRTTGTPEELSFILPVGSPEPVYYSNLIPDPDRPGLYRPGSNAEPLPAPVAAPAPAPAPVAPSTARPSGSVSASSLPASSVTPSGTTGVSYIHKQTTATATWIVRHPLKRKPLVLLLVGGRQVYADVEYPNNDQVTIIWPTRTAGEAHLI